MLNQRFACEVESAILEKVWKFLNKFSLRRGKSIESKDKNFKENDGFEKVWKKNLNK